MKKFFTSASGMDARGVGPRIMLITAPVLLFALYAEIRKANFAEIVPEPGNLTIALGWLWLTAGLIFFFTAMAQFILNFPKGKLITTGVYAFSRNPIYSSWVVFILPATGMLCNNWVFLAAALVMGIATVLMVKEEETQLLKIFGKEYSRYKSNVGCLMGFSRKLANEA